jgi:hypothetical protein
MRSGGDMFASQAQAVVDGVGTGWIPIVLFAAAIVAFWRLAIRIIVIAIVMIILAGVITFAGFMHGM